MARPIEVPNLDDLAERYNAGESMKTLAAELGIARKTLKSKLLARGVVIRGRDGEAVRLAIARMSPAELAAYTEKCRAGSRALRGIPFTEARAERTAAGRARSHRWITPDEQLLADAIRAAGAECVQQPAVGRYNPDIAIGEVAVEVETLHAASSSRSRWKLLDRLDYLLDRGNVAWVFHCPAVPLDPASVAEHLIAFSQLTSGSPAGRGEYRMMWGDAQYLSRGDHQLDELARILPTKATTRLRPRD